MAARAELARWLRRLGWAALSAGVFVLNVRTPPELRLGILYVIPVLLAAWHDGLGWGVSFALGTTLLRFGVGIDQMPERTLLEARIINELAYFVVVGVVIVGLSQLCHT